LAFPFGIPDLSVLVWTSSAGQPDFRLQDELDRTGTESREREMRNGKIPEKRPFIFVKSLYEHTFKRENGQKPHKIGVF
jgi:hypothetical protein